MLVRLEQQRRRPGVVHDDADAPRVGGGHDGGHVLDLEALRARCLDQHGPRIVADQAGDLAADQGIVERRRHAELLEDRVAESARGAIGGIGHQQVVAGAEHGQQCERDCGKPGGRQHGSGRARDLGPGLLQRRRGGRAVGAVGVALRPAAQIGDVLEQHRGAAIDRRVDEAVLLERLPPSMDQPGARLQGSTGFWRQLHERALGSVQGGVKVVDAVPRVKAIKGRARAIRDNRVRGLQLDRSRQSGV